MSTLNPVEGQSQATSLPIEDQSSYPGYFWGAAGIADVLIELLNSSVLDLSMRDTANDILDDAVQGIWESRMTNIEDEKIPAWRKLPDTEIYPGKKYGAAGISDMLLNLYSFTDNSTYLEMANASIYELYSQVKHFDLPHWPYAYYFSRGSQGIYITDQNFGSMGIVDSTLRLIEYTNDTYLLDLAANATRWVYNNSNPIEVAGQEGRIIPWYSSNERLNNSYTSYGWGNAGALPVLLKLYEQTKDQLWRQWAEFISVWLTDVQKEDGSWTQNPVANGISGLDFENGVPGILHSLNQANRYLDNQTVASAITKGQDWLLSQFISNSSYAIFPTYSNSGTARYSLYLGMSGINMVLRELSSNSVEFDSSIEWILEQALYRFSKSGEDLIGLYPSTAEEDYTDLSYTHGLSGVVLELLHTHQEGIKDIDPSIFNSYVLTLEEYQEESGLWPRQVEISQFSRILSNVPTQLVIVAVLGLLGIIIYYRRAKSKTSEHQ